MTSTEIDPRSTYTDALAWVAELVAAVRPAHLGDPTRCPELDVRDIVSHLVATVDRIAAIGAGGSPDELPTQADATDDWPTALAEAGERMAAVWADPAVLAHEVRVPWGTASGQVALWAYVNELLVHGWDLAVATGQPVEAPAGLAEPTLEMARHLIPLERDGFPFAAPVEPSAQAGPTERLANWSGHRR